MPYYREGATPFVSRSTWLRPGELILRRSFPARPDSPREARRAIGTLALVEAARTKLNLVVTELVTNAVRHARPCAHDPIGLLVTRLGGEVRVAVHDRGRGFSPGEVDVDCKEGGLGLMIVDSLSTAWGVDCGGNGSAGCTVWCTLEAERAA